MSDTGDWLRDAAEYIGEHGWTQGQIKDRNTGAVCAMGALCMTEGHRAFHWKDAVSAVAKVAGVTLVTHQLAEGFGVFAENGIPEWNDAPERTAEEVVLTFKRAAELVDE